MFQANQNIEKFSKFGPSDYENRFVPRISHQVKSEIIPTKSSGFESRNFANSLGSSSSDSSDSDDSDDSTDDYSFFMERPISPPKAIFGASDSFVEDPYGDWSALIDSAMKLQTREGPCDRK